MAVFRRSSTFDPLHAYAVAMSNWNTSWTRNTWRPDEPKLFVRRTDGMGWAINFAHLFGRTRRNAAS